MALTARYFRWKHGEWTRLLGRWFDRIMDGSEQVDDGPLQTATVYVELDDRVPVAISRPPFDRSSLLSDGSVDKHKVMQGAMLAVDAMSNTSADDVVIDAESRFARRRHQAETIWHPTAELLDALVKAIERTGVTARLARLKYIIAQRRGRRGNSATHHDEHAPFSSINSSTPRINSDETNHASKNAPRRRAS